MYSEELKPSNLAKELSAFDYVFLDTCSLMEDSFPSFMDTLTKSREYWKDGFEVVVLGECVSELKKHAKSKDSQEARIEAKRALKILHHDKWHDKVLEITKTNSNYGFADNAIYSTVSSLRIQKKVLVITQDKTLTTDLRKQNHLESQRGRFVVVKRLTASGDLEDNPGETYDRNQSRKADSTYRGKEHFKKDYSRPATPVETKAFDSALVLDNDRKLAANLANPTYPVGKKISDINDQISLLSSTSFENIQSLKLVYPLSKLVSAKADLNKAPAKNSAPIKTEKAKEAPAKKDEEKPAIQKSAAKPAPIAQKPVETPIKKQEARPTGSNRLWFEFGSTVQEAIGKCASRKGWIFRDASVHYEPMIHGPFDVTSDDLDKVARGVPALKTGESYDAAFKGLLAHIEKTERDYKATLEEEAFPKVVAPTAVPVIEPAPAKVEATPVYEEAPKEKPAKAVAEKPVSKAKAEKKGTVAHEKKLKVVASKAKSTRRAAPKAKPAEEVKPVAVPEKVAAPSVKAQSHYAAVPAGATLIVGVPSDVRKKEFIERRSRREDGPVVEIMKDESHAVSRKRVAKASPKKEVSKPSKPVSAHPAHKAAPSKPSAKFEAIAKEDANLNAKINNPTYPVPNKIKDLAEQRARVKTLSAEQSKGLHFTVAAIDKKLEELKAK